MEGNDAARWLRVFQWAWALRFAVRVANEVVPRAFALDVGWWAIFGNLVAEPALVAVSSFAVVRASSSRAPRLLAGLAAAVAAPIALHWLVRYAFVLAGHAPSTKELDGFASFNVALGMQIPLVVALTLVTGATKREAARAIAPIVVLLAFLAPWWWETFPRGVTALLVSRSIQLAAFLFPFLLARRGRRDLGGDAPSDDAVVLGSLRVWLLAFVALAATATWRATFEPTPSGADLDLQTALWFAFVAVPGLALVREVRGPALVAIAAAFVHALVVWSWSLVYDPFLTWARQTAARTAWVRTNTIVTLVELAVPYVVAGACAVVVARIAARQQRPWLARSAWALGVVALAFAPWAAWLELKTAVATPLEITVLRRSDALLWVALAVVTYQLMRPADDAAEPAEVSVGGVD